MSQPCVTRRTPDCRSCTCCDYEPQTPPGVLPADRLLILLEARTVPFLLLLMKNETSSNEQPSCSEAQKAAERKIFFKSTPPFVCGGNKSDCFTKTNDHIHNGSLSSRHKDQKFSTSSHHKLTERLVPWTRNLFTCTARPLVGTAAGT